MGVGRGVGFAIDAHHLLPGGVGHARENARLGHRGVTLIFQDAAHRDVLVTEGPDKKAARFVLSDDPDRQNVNFQVGKVVNSIRAAAGDDGALAMLEDEDGGFARDARNLAVDELVGNKVGERSDGHLGKDVEDFLEPLGFFGMSGHPGSFRAGETPALRSVEILSWAVPSLGDDPQHGIQGVSGVDEIHVYRHHRQRLQGGEVGP